MNLKGVLFFCDWRYFQDAAPLLNQAKKYCFHGIWKRVIFQSSNIASQRGKEKKIKRHTKDSESKCIHHLVLPTQSAKSQTTQAPSDITEKSATACCRRTSRVQLRNRPGWECRARFRLSGFLAQFCLVRWRHCVALHFLAAQNSQAEDCEHPAPLITTCQFFSARRCKCKWHISRG